jgi:hypothetical protein
VTAVARHLPGWRCEVRQDLAGLPRLARIDRGPTGGSEATPS